MTQNRFDQASRYLAKLDPEGLLTWLFSPDELPIDFLGWLDTRTLPFPGDPERTCDTVAWLRHRERPEDWAVPIEFNHEPDSTMFGRLLVYLGLLWLEQRPSDNRSTRFHVGAIVVNLTGRGQTARDMQLRPLRTQLHVIERNLSHAHAATALDGIAAGTTARCLLPWIPLMRGAEDSAILDAWKVIAGAETDNNRRAEYAGLALVFAEAANHLAAWKDTLKGWKMVESKVVLEWITEGEIKAQVHAVLRLLEKKFPPGASGDVAAAIKSSKDPDQLSGWFDAAIDATSLDDFRKIFHS